MGISFFIITAFVCCVVLIVMFAVRPGVFRLFVREFTSKNATSNEENQEQTSVNWKKGCLRLTVVLSFLFGGIAAIINAEFYIASGAFWLGFFKFFGLTWIIYFATSFVINGFTSKK